MLTAWWSGVVLAVLAIVGTLAATSMIARRGQLGAEASRKLAHVAIGTGALALPLLLRDPGAVLTAFAGITAVLLGIRRSRRMHRIFGGALHAAPRESTGEFCFAAAIALLLLAADSRPLLYIVPVLILTFADSAAALAGQRFARHKPETRKTLVGSGVFFVVALVCTLLPLRALTALDWPAAWAIALFVSSVTTALEWVARRGLDNLLVPAGAFAVLLAVGVSDYRPPGPPEIAIADDVATVSGVRR